MMTIWSYLLLAVVTTPVCSEFYISNHNLNFSDAKNFCELRNQSLLVAPTYDEYSMFEEQLKESEFLLDDFWIGVYRPSGAYEYQWINGRKLNVYWNYTKLENLIQARCVVVHANNGLWKTKECSQNTYYVCVDYTISAVAYTFYDHLVNYTTARENCENKGQDLVMIKSRLQHDALKSFLKSKRIGIWIGLEGFGIDEQDYRKFKWIDGNYLNTVDGKLKSNVDLGPDQRCVFYENGEWNETDCVIEKPYICIDDFSSAVRHETTIYYILIKEKKPYMDPLESYMFRSLPRCATECSKSINCYMYTYDGINCELFEQSAILVKNDFPDRKLYVRRV